MPLQTKRIYDSDDPSDGKRILIDRLWPRGVSKERADLYGWFKDVAPSPELREWFGHKPERYEEFRERYLQELVSDETKQPELEQIRKLSQTGTVTLLYAAKSPTINHAIVLLEYLEKSTQR
ncbi:MAG: DUF488 family protein [Coriobacteriia bacterium]|nr:DUF488 family protein [Coriobacteriia bacterium]